MLRFAGMTARTVAGGLVSQLFLADREVSDADGIGISRQFPIFLPAPQRGSRIIPDHRFRMEQCTDRFTTVNSAHGLGQGRRNG